MPRQWGVFIYPRSGAVAEWPGPIPRLIGHRGAALIAPENTLASIRAAADAGARWVEVDARLTADNVPVVMHDATLERTTTGAGRVRDATAAAVAALDAGGWFDAAFAGEAVPTLQQAVDLARELHIGLNVELKPDRDTSAATGEFVGQILSGRSGLLLSCFDAACLRAAKGAALPLALNTKQVTAEALATARGLDCCAIHFAKEGASPTAAATIAEAGMVAGVFTVNDPAVANRLLAMGVSYIITDDPVLLASI